MAAVWGIHARREPPPPFSLSCRHIPVTDIRRRWPGLKASSPEPQLRPPRRHKHFGLAAKRRKIAWACRRGEQLPAWSSAASPPKTLCSQEEVPGLAEEEDSRRVCNQYSPRPNGNNRCEAEECPGQQRMRRRSQGGRRDVPWDCLAGHITTQSDLEAGLRRCWAACCRLACGSGGCCC